MKYRCLVVDDEPLARRALVNHMAQIPSLELIGEAANANVAAAILHRRMVDVLFLDIRMPGLSGLDLLRTLTLRPQVILTTAFTEFALEGYEHAVVDYLVKPIPFERFLQAVNKLRPADSLPSEQPRSLMLRVGSDSQRVHLADIRVVEAYGNFVKIHTHEGQILASETLKKMVSVLPQNRFIQVHRSFVVAVEMVTRFAGDHVNVSGMDVPVGRFFRKMVESRLKSG